MTKLKHKYSTPTDSNYFFGYFDRTPFSSDSNKFLFHSVDFRDRQVVFGDEALIGYFQLDNKNKKEIIYKTKSWNWQNGSGLQWLNDGKEQLILNDFIDDDHRGIILHDGKVTKTFEKSVYCINNNSKLAVTLNLVHLSQYRSSYTFPYPENLKLDYSNDEFLSVFDLNTGNTILNISSHMIADILGIQHTVVKNGYVDHALFNPSGTKCYFNYRNSLPDGGVISYLIIVDLNLKTMKCILKTSMLGHLCWINDDILLIFGSCNEFSKIRMNQNNIISNLIKFTKYINSVIPIINTSVVKYIKGDCFFTVDTTNSVTKKIINNDYLNQDGHPNSAPLNKSLFLTDTYPNSEGIIFLRIINIDSGHLIEEIKLQSNPNTMNTEFRCDAHPRWSPNQSMIAVDRDNKFNRSIDIFSYED